MTALGRSFRGQRGRVLLRESVAVTAAGGPAPQADWRPQDVTPDLSRAMTAETLSAARDSICTAFGVLPSLFASAAHGPLVREDRKSVVSGKSVSVRVDLGGRRILKKKNTKTHMTTSNLT